MCFGSWQGAARRGTGECAAESYNLGVPPLLFAGKSFPLNGLAVAWRCKYVKIKGLRLNMRKQ